MAGTAVDPVRNENESFDSKKTEKNRISNGVDIKQLLEAGAHFGHRTSRWHPKMAPYIHTKRGGIHIIDLTKTVEKLENALDFLTQVTASGKQVLVVGTKRQVREIARELAENVNMPYVTERWLGGMLTNRNTIGARIKHLKELEAKMATGELANKYSKLEVQRYHEEIDRMNHMYGGIKEMAARVGVVIVFDPTHDHNAVSEARKLNLPIIALCDSNADPSLVTYPIPCNDDAIKTLKLVSDYFQQAIEAGKAKAKQPADPDKNSSNSNGAGKTETNDKEAK